LALPQSHRLKGQRVFDQLYKKGRRIHGPSMLLRVLDAEQTLLPIEQQTHSPSPWRCGVVVSTKVHKRAVRRNRLRRLLHGHVLTQPIGTMERPRWILLSLKPGSAELPCHTLLGECNQLLHQAGLTP
jgi:ribonuclease P protein component